MKRQAVCTVTTAKEEVIEKVEKVNKQMKKTHEEIYEAGLDFFLNGLTDE